MGGACSKSSPAAAAPTPIVSTPPAATTSTTSQSAPAAPAPSASPPPKMADELTKLKEQNILLRKESERLLEANEELKATVNQLSSQQPSDAAPATAAETKDDKEFADSMSVLKQKAFTIIVVGASGHLARTKTYPALFALFTNGFLPPHANIVGFSRSAYTDEDFRKQNLEKYLSGKPEQKQKFLSVCTYVAGDYGDVAAFGKLSTHCQALESKAGGPAANRMFYFAIPPSVYADTARCIKAAATSSTGWTRIVVEKPFGKDTESFKALSADLLKHFAEEQIYRIDHYLGKEIVQNLLTLRFANMVFEPLFNRNYVANVTITFKENQGIEGRGGYFDEFGIIRDVMQNHLMQILSLVAMEPPVSLEAEDIRNAKVTALRQIKPLRLQDVVIGQYLGDADKKQPGYAEDPSVPKGSTTPTFAMAVMNVRSQRWDGVPFILKCGKGLNEKKAEIRIQFKHLPGSPFGDMPVNELVLRVQPKESIYLKLNSKSPGLSESTHQTELNLTYQNRFNVGTLPDAYERLILDVMRGDHRLFVRNDELEHAWAIFTPVLHQLENEKIKPLPYKFGSRGPDEADELAKRVGFKRYTGYEWNE